MEIRIEFLALRGKHLHAVLLQHLGEFALRQLDALDQRPYIVVGGIRKLGADGIERAMHVVGDLQNVARKSGHAILPRIGNFTVPGHKPVFVLVRFLTWFPTIGPRVRAKDKYLDSPFNTYENEGLPPAAIANPGEAALEAALRPEDTACLFYIHDRNRNIHCASDYATHKKNIARYL